MERIKASDPEVLLNIGLCHEQLNQLQEVSPQP